MRAKLDRMSAAIGLAAVAVLATGSPARAWEFVEVLSPLGDHATGIVQPATNQPGIALAIACEGDRWRQVALLPEVDNPFRLASSGDVRYGFSPQQLGPKGPWKPKKLGDGRRAYFAPSPSLMVKRLADEARKNPKAVFYVQASPSKKSPIVLHFPLAGMPEAIRKHLWEPCKLDVYVGEGDGERK
ncbi:MAG: hypothetical protein FJ144_27035 [Deltaproteobacteria bacterium]|nr:hypothetical protein [Deltaproteobacteria bacterium]